jgi:hypothetical protein
MGWQWYRTNRRICILLWKGGMRTMNWVWAFFVHKRIISAVKRSEFISDRMSYIILRGRWFHVMGLNVHAPTEDNIDDMKETFYEEFEHIYSIISLNTT